MFIYKDYIFYKVNKIFIFIYFVIMFNICSRCKLVKSYIYLIIIN